MHEYNCDFCREKRKDLFLLVTETQKSKEMEENHRNYDEKIIFFYGSPGASRESSTRRGILWVSSERPDAIVSLSSTEYHLSETVVAITHVPPHQVPTGVLNLIHSYRSMIHHVRVAISAPAQLLTQTSQSNQDYIILIMLKNPNFAHTMVHNLHEKPFTCLQVHDTAKVQHVLRVEDDHGTPIHWDVLFPLNLDASPTIKTTSVSGNSCPVCLETLTASTSITDRSNSSPSPTFNELKSTLPDTRNAVFTTACTHSFHLDCFVKCQDSPCPVCRFDHSSINDSLSSCQICGSTDHIYICLICGVVSCQEPETLILGESHEYHTQSHKSTTLSLSSNAPWDHSHKGHARMHYQQTMHTYALEVQSQYVFDFAGDGYVHRLIQNKEDGKLVEISDPRNNNPASQERGAYTPGLSDEQQEHVVHTKLERLAQRYQNMLRYLMDQQRHYYQDILQDLRRQLDIKSSPVSIKHRTASSGNTTSLITALKKERHQLQQKHDTLKKKYIEIMDNVKFVQDFNDSLEANQVLLRSQITDAQKERRDIEELLKTRLPPLEEKLQNLMLELDKDLDGI